MKKYTCKPTNNIPKMINLFPSSLHLRLFFIFNMKKSFPEPQLGEDHTQRQLKLLSVGGGNSLLCFMWSVAGRTSVLLQGCWASVCILHAHFISSPPESPKYYSGAEEKLQLDKECLPKP